MVPCRSHRRGAFLGRFDANFLEEFTMSDVSDWPRSCASEFPNDNPALHDGAVWVCFAPCGPLRPVVRPKSGGRRSTIPAAPFASPVQDVAAPVSNDDASVTEVTSLAGPAQNDAIPPPPPTVELESLDDTQGHPAPVDLDPEEMATPEGCSLSAGLAPVEIPSEDVRVSEMRERANGAPATAEIESVVECTPPPPPIVEASDATALAEDPEGRRTILPPPSEDAQTLTLTRIHVSGRSQAPAGAAEIVATSVDSPSEHSAVASAAEPEGARPDPFAAFVAALVEVALTAGATRAAAVLPGFLAGDAQEFDGFPDTVRASLVSAGLVSDEHGALAPSAAFGTTANAWRMVLRGESNDFSACGTSTLDGWAGDLLKSFGVGRDGRIDVKRELRRRGVAAFGMILAA
jgi:hypothetical protein